MSYGFRTNGRILVMNMPEILWITCGILLI
jgi:hypothetical protein